MDSPAHELRSQNWIFVLMYINGALYLILVLYKACTLYYRLVLNTCTLMGLNTLYLTEQHLGLGCGILCGRCRMCYF